MAEDEAVDNGIQIVQASLVEQQTRAEVDIQIATAHRYPRNIGQVKKDMISFATMDEETAASCFYSLPRGGKTIQGRSIRLAEIAVASYGNIRAQTRIKEQHSDGEHPFVTVECAVHDLEKNVAVCIEKRRRITCKKSKLVVDDDDINLAVNSCAAIAFRDAVFKVVPGTLTNAVYDAAKQVAVGDVKSIGQRFEKACTFFGKFGKIEKDILAFLGKPDNKSITLDDIEKLIGLSSAIKDGEIGIDDAFKPAPVAEGQSLLTPGSHRTYKKRQTKAEEPAVAPPQGSSPDAAVPPPPTAPVAPPAGVERKDIPDGMHRPSALERLKTMSMTKPDLVRAELEAADFDPDMMDHKAIEADPEAMAKISRIVARVASKMSK
jgi:hypothetical protein